MKYVDINVKYQAIENYRAIERVGENFYPDALL